MWTQFVLSKLHKTKDEYEKKKNHYIKIWRFIKFEAMQIS